MHVIFLKKKTLLQKPSKLGPICEGELNYSRKMFVVECNSRLRLTNNIVLRLVGIAIKNPSTQVGNI